MPPQGLNDQDMAANSVGDMQVADDNETVDSPGCCKRCTDRIILTLEGWFARYVPVFLYIYFPHLGAKVRSSFFVDLFSSPWRSTP